MNKLAVVAFALLLFFSTMLWYLANGSLNEYLESQIRLQGHYYSGQKTTLSFADFSANSDIVTFKGINLANLELYQAKNALIIDEASVELSPQQNQTVLTEINKITINKLTLNIEWKNNENNIDQLIDNISLKLAKDYPQHYPQISAKLYAKSHPDLNAEAYTKDNPQAGPIVEHTEIKKTRGRPQQKLKISAIHIKNLEVNTTQLNITTTTQKIDLNLDAIGDPEGLISNQIGGEILLRLLNTKN